MKDSYNSLNSIVRPLHCIISVYTQVLLIRHDRFSLARGRGLPDYIYLAWSVLSSQETSSSPSVTTPNISVVENIHTAEDNFIELSLSLNGPATSGFAYPFQEGRIAGHRSPPHVDTCGSRNEMKLDLIFAIRDNGKYCKLHTAMQRKTTYKIQPAESASREMCMLPS